jgi:hypothetical protein
LNGEADERPVSIGRSPQLDPETRRGAHSIERMWATVGVDGNSGLGSRFSGNQPGPAVFPGHGNFRAYDLADQANEVAQEILWAVLRIDLVSYFEQRTALFPTQSPATRPGFIG